MIGALIKELEKTGHPQQIELLFRELERDERVPFLARLSDDYLTPHSPVTALLVEEISNECLTDDDVLEFLKLVPPDNREQLPKRVREALQSRLAPLVEAVFDNPASFHETLWTLHPFYSLLGSEQETRYAGLVRFANELDACKDGSVEGLDFVARVTLPLRDSHSVHTTDDEAARLAKFVYEVVHGAGLASSLPAAPIITIKQFFVWKDEEVHPDDKATTGSRGAETATIRIRSESAAERARNRKKSKKPLSAQRLVRWVIIIVASMLLVACAIALIAGILRHDGHERSLGPPTAAPRKFLSLGGPSPYPSRDTLWSAQRVGKQGEYVYG